MPPVFESQMSAGRTPMFITQYSEDSGDHYMKTKHSDFTLGSFLKDHDILHLVTTEHARSAERAIRTLKMMMEKLSTGSAAAEPVHSSRLSHYAYERRPGAPPGGRAQPPAAG